MGSLCKVVAERDVGTFNSDSTIKTLAFNSNVTGGKLYDLELNDGTICTFIINGSDIISVDITVLPNDTTPINYVLNNVVSILNEQDNISLVLEKVQEASDLKNQIQAIYDDLSPNFSTFNSLVADKVALDSIYADKATFDSLLNDKVTLDSLYADKAKLNDIYNNLVQLLDSENNAQEALDSKNTTLSYMNQATTARNEALGFRNEAEQFKIDAEQSNTGQLETKVENLAGLIYPSQLVRGSVSVDNKVKTPTQVTSLWTGNGTSQSINVGMSLIDFTQPSNGTGYSLVRGTIGNAVIADGSSELAGNPTPSPSGGSYLIEQHLEIEKGDIMVISFDVSSYVAGFVNIEHRTSANAFISDIATNVSGNGSYSFSFTADGADEYINLYSGVTSPDYVITNYSVRKASKSGHIDFGTIVGIDGVGKVHIKGRDVAYDNIINDGLRGVGKNIFSNVVNAEQPISRITSFNSTGFSLNSDAGVNENTKTYVAYTTLYTNIAWTTTNHGKLCVTAYNPQSLDVMCYYEGSNIAGHELPTLLGMELSFVASKSLTGTQPWLPTRLNNGKYMEYSTIAETTGISTNCDDKVLSLPAQDRINGVETYILYGFANAYYNDEGDLIGNKEAGTYIGTGLTGNKVDTLGKPAEIVCKGVSVTSDWVKFDNGTLFAERLYLNSPTSSATSSNRLESVVNNGFNLVSSDINLSQEEYIYLVSYDTDYNGNGASQMLPSTTSNLQLNCTVNLGGETSKNLDIVETVDTSSVTESGEYYVLEVI